eukprot:325754-Chlamydomonas_euryale.AAC.1
MGVGKCWGWGCGPQTASALLAAGRGEQRTHSWAPAPPSRQQKHATLSVVVAGRLHRLLGLRVGREK